MDAVGVAQIVAAKTLKEHDFNRCLSFAFTISEALQIVYGIDEIEFLDALAGLDIRFKEGYTKKRILIPNDGLNASSGSVYIGRVDLAEARKAGDYGIFTIVGKGMI